MKSVRLLIVEDESLLVAQLVKNYESAFAEHGYTVEVTCATTVNEARTTARAARDRPFDLVSLDVNLGDAELSGLDVLGTLRRFKAGWMVALLTGVETDSTLEKTMGSTKADEIRRRLRRDAYERFPAERLFVIEKPARTLAMDEADRLLRNRVGQIALLYREIGRLRFIFRPIEVVSLERVTAPKGRKTKRHFIETVTLHWQIRFDCGEIRTLPDKAGLRTLHHLLAMDRGESLTPEQAQAIEPRQERRGTNDATDEDPVATFFEAQGIAWGGLSYVEKDKMIAAALALRFKRYVELRTWEEDEDISAEEADELHRLQNELGPLAGAAETAYRRMAGWDGSRLAEVSLTTEASLREGSLQRSSGGNYEKAGADVRGYDSPEARSFRKRMERTRDYLRENGFADFASHLESYLMSTGANWSYNPNDGIEWTTS